MLGSERLQPRPNGPFPAAESYASDSCGPNPERPGDVAIGTVMEPVPVTGLAANFSPRPRIAPPPLGSERDGGLVRNESADAVPSPAVGAASARFRDPGATRAPSSDLIAVPFLVSQIRSSCKRRVYPSWLRLVPSGSLLDGLTAVR